LANSFNINIMLNAVRSAQLPFLGSWSILLSSNGILWFENRSMQVKVDFSSCRPYIIMVLQIQKKEQQGTTVVSNQGLMHCSCMHEFA